MDRFSKILLRATIVIASVLIGPTGCEQNCVIKLSDGSCITQQSLQGKWVYINYWAEWCKPCRKEIPEFNQFSQMYPDTVVMLGINFDKVEGEELQALKHRMGIEFAVVRHDLQTLLDYPVTKVLPTTVVINPQGQYYRSLIGPQTIESLEGVMHDE